jgi:hypothetical protein
MSAFHPSQTITTSAFGDGDGDGAVRPLPVSVYPGLFLAFPRMTGNRKRAAHL